jgi:biopolymer transport protein TolQ
MALVGTSARWDLWDIIFGASTEVWLILLILMAFSILSWSIIVAKFMLLRRTRHQTERFFEIFDQQPTFSSIYKSIKTEGLEENPFAAIFIKGYEELLRMSKTVLSQSPRQRVSEPARLAVRWQGLEGVERAIRQEGSAQVHRFERAMGVLATTGSTAPFIGLFGTVLGIIRSFHEIGLRGSASLATVAPGISEALVATAAGLAAAIPAVVAYNFFVQRIRTIASEIDQFVTELFNLVERQLRIASARMPQQGSSRDEEEEEQRVHQRPR